MAFVTEEHGVFRGGRSRCPFGHFESGLDWTPCRLTGGPHACTIDRSNISHSDATNRDAKKEKEKRRREENVPSRQIWSRIFRSWIGSQRPNPRRFTVISFFSLRQSMFSSNLKPRDVFSKKSLVCCMYLVQCC